MFRVFRLFTLPIITFYCSLSLASSIQFEAIEGDTLKFKDESGVSREVKITRITDIHHEFDLIEAEPGDSQETKELIALYNLESKWITGKRYIYVQGKKLEITIAQELQLLRARASLANNEISPDLTEEERQFLDLKIKEIQKAISQKANYEQEKTKLKNSEPFKPVGNIEKAIEKAAQNGGEAYFLLLDGLPYLTSNLEGNTLAKIHLNSKTLEVRAADIEDCNMPTSAPNTTERKLKLNANNTIYHDEIILAEFNRANTIFITDTRNGGAFCNPSTVYRIFKDGFEASSAPSLKSPQKGAK